ncbi:MULTISPECIES: HigA family addiction module antitoxin [Lactobacillaceae]|jgi:addiction module antidote protein HigA|uniref:HTH-type transcriptional regulator YbaQ n=4 Tax=Lactobacillaceae TaxID=33958 RepID=A0ABY3BBU6_LACGS|nr:MULTISPECIES: HigA family addiction module antitoxin [Lactobacillaceae]EEX23405.1 addiction module antidote protein HigA [Lactobacillus jensenii 115-3-CHN]EFB62725.1 addiction module antidote protein HigA [Lactobacillus gasseri 224-1]EFH30277.1 addiction module antidote protein HigA [Lactobacillus jensenii JV-V16]EEQ26635.1 addiction module antidote protein HigA [Lactobacillus gasseri 202-4]KAA9361579.1 HigA family addiction module antidote protein [Lactobacillus jensenii]
MLKNTIPTPKISEVLSEEFMKPLNLSAYAVAKAIDVPSSRILDILHDKRKITVDTSVRLGKLFGVSPKFFLNIQNDIELRNAELANSKEYDKIKKISFA